jgi:NADPH2:quinone reductase
MSESHTNHAFRLRKRPNGDLADGDLELVTEEIPELTDGQALVRTQLLSLDPTNRIWMSDIRGYMPAVPIDAVMRGLGVGEVIESKRDDMPVGATVSGFTGWQELVLADDSLLEAPLSVLPDPLPAPLSAFLGAIGHTGITAYIGIDNADLKEGETIVISAACGAVGSIAGQIAAEKGARVVGVAGGPEKCAHAVEKLGYDVCVDHRADDWREQLDAATPDGIDVDFENVGGPIMDHILGRLNIGARVSLCGMIAEYNTYNEGGEHSGGLTNIGQLIMQRATIQGFLVLDYADRFEEAINHLAGMLGAGKLNYDETIVDGGIEAAPHALAQLFSGANMGKLLVRVSE